jgi:hypothetical protein
MSYKDTPMYKIYPMIRTVADTGHYYKKFNCASQVKTMLNECGLLHIWTYQDLYVPCITDIAAQNWHDDVAG